MDDFGNSLSAKLRDAADLLNAGQKKEARRLLREALEMDRNNLATWELLWRAVYNVKEEMHCLNRILAIDPNHSAARQRLVALKSTSRESPKRSPSRKKRQESIILLLLLGSLVSIVCVGVAGFALLRGGYIPFALPNRTATAIADKNSSCQALIDKAIQASDDFCGDTGSNNACYGNTTIKADLVPDSTKRFSERGDKVSVNELQRLSASPLKLDSNEWGIAVFKVIANLPRSLPGETVTMVVFGNTTLDNESGNLESFYFYSELGQISCEKVPFDGLMITSPEGSGVRFTVNGTELTLMGTASLKAQKNGEMEISLYRGSARVVSKGEEQYLGAGQKLTVQLGGENGTQSTSAPSEPEPLSQQELDVACTMTGSYCSQDAIIPVSESEAQGQIQGQITSTPTLTLTPSLTFTPSATIPATSTLLILPSGTSSPKPTTIVTPTRTRTPGPTNTRTPTNTFTPVTPTNTFTFTPVTPSNTPVTPTLTFTPITSTVTPTGPTEPICSNVSLGTLTNPNLNEFGVDIINDSGGTITLNRFFAYWVKSSPNQKVDRLLLDGILLWNTSDNEPPTNIPTEGSWRGGADRTIPYPGATGTKNFVVQFQENLDATGYELHFVFDIGCQVIATK